ncbi:RHS repeat-associated core domain-containing protein [Brevibacillus sp. HB1.1]|uniref:RHS repeat-associated core domain-containing protein n=1 Tax=Brevibacillus sp. HB1.1 TaxID=2738808 RepID=UPI0020C6F481|nr:RHS repeat-associated core domain-containing protein [Brevibacillus sp. HB1.1]
MNTTEKLAGYENIQLVSPFEIQSLQDVRIVRKVNEHARLFVTGIIPEEKSDRYIEMATSEDTVALNLVENGALTKTLFKGLVDSVSVNFVHGVYHLELEAVSHTQRMDGQRKLRSFQNKKMSYASLLDEITKDYPGSDYLDHASNGAPLGTIAIQYQETDWQFLKRLASRFGSILVAEAVADKPKFWFGLPEGRTAQLTDASYTISKRLAPYMETTENGYAAGMSENDFLTYEVESGQVLQLGDRVNYQGKELVVAGSTTRIDHALLIHTYQLMPEAGIRQNPIRNDDICGAALEGKIIDIQKDTVKIHLDIDQKQPKAEASWFPYATVYSAEGNSGFHCMPQMGDSVKLYFSTPDEEGAMAVSSVRKGGGSTAKTGNPGIKYWGTNFGKELMMGGKELVLTAKESKEGNIFIKLHEEDGIEIHSMHPIVFSSEKDMEIRSDTKVEIKAKEAIYLMCSTSSMILDGEVDLQAPKIEMVGLTKAPVVVEDLPQEEEEEVVEEEQEEEDSGWGFLDSLQLGLDIVGMIPVIGEVADVVNAGISVARGDYAGAAMSLAAAIPGAGTAVTAAKLTTKAVKATKAMTKATKAVKAADKALGVSKAVKATANAASAVKGKVVTAARNIQESMDKLAAVQKLKKSMVGKFMQKPVVKEVIKEAGSEALDYATDGVFSTVAGIAGGRKRIKGKHKKPGKVRKMNVKKVKPKSCIKDPVHGGTGAQFIVHPALKLYGAETWTFELHYNSLLLQEGALGKAWTHNYEMRLQFLDETREEITVWWNAGRANTFTRVQDGLYRSSDADVFFDELRERQDGYTLWVKETRETYDFARNGQALRHTVAAGMSLLFSYDQHGRLNRLTEERSRQAFSLEYGADGLVSALSDGTRSLRFSYDAERRMTRYTNPNGVVTDLSYTGNDQLESLASDGVIVYTNTFDEEGRIICQTDAAGIPSYIHYDTESRPGMMVTTFTDGNGHVEIMIHDDNGQLLEKTEKDGTLTKYTYNEWGQTTSETNGAGETTTYTYDSRGNLVKETDPLGNTTTYTYNEKDLMTAEEDAEGGVTTFAYDEHERLVSMTRPDGCTSSIGYNEHGQRSTYIDFTGAKTTYHYDGQGMLVSAQDPEGRIFRVGFDPTGRMTTFTDAFGGSLRQVFDANDNLVGVTDPLGRMHSFTYDTQDCRVEETTASGASTKIGYTIIEKVESITNAYGETTRYEYDKEWQIVGVVDPTGAKTSLDRDAMGRVTAVTDPLGNTQRYEYDGAGRLLAVYDATGQKVSGLTYDGAGNILAHIDGLGRTTQYQFNKLHQVIATTNAAGQKTKFSYDAAARLTEVLENEAAVYRQQYDGEGRLTSYTDANGNATTLSYDASGLLLAERNATGEGTTYRYDKRGWLTDKTNARGLETHYRYDAAGQLIEQQDEAGTVRRTFDAEGRVVSVKEDGKDTKRRTYDLLGRIVSSTDQYGNTLQYTYDAGGRLATLIYPDGKTVGYIYDLAGQLTTVTDWAGRVTRYTYDENYRLIRTERPNGTVEQRHYDVAGQLLRLWDQNAQGVMLQQYRFLYNELGQLIQEEEKQYTYDALRRLTSGSMAGRKILYTYDQGGNITAIGDSGSSLATAMTYAKDNRLDTVDGQHVQYDEDGNLLLLPGKQQSETYAYDARNRLVRAGQARYTYDAEYVRTSMTWNGKTTRYVVDQNADLTQVLMELEESGAAKAYYVYGLGLIGREDAQGDYLSYHADTRGSTTLLTDEHGRVTDRYTYGLYGELEEHEGRTKQPFCYNGRDGVMTDPNGLYYMRARYYHPGLKRFLNRDVLQGDMTDGQTFNRFAYVNGDPIGFIDPLGLMKCKDETAKKKVTPATKKVDELGEYYETTIRFETNVKWGDEYRDMNRRDFNRKVKYLQKLSDANLLRKVKPVRDQELTKKYKAAVIKKIIKHYYHRDKELAKKLIDKVRDDLDPDHMWDLGLDGPDVKRNLKLMDQFTNRRLGGVLGVQLKDVPYGSRIKIKIER